MQSLVPLLRPLATPVIRAVAGFELLTAVLVSLPSTRVLGAAATFGVGIAVVALVSVRSGQSLPCGCFGAGRAGART